MVRLSSSLAVLCVLASLPVAGCLARDGGGDDGNSTNVVLSTGTGDASTGDGGGSTTKGPGIETTTVEPMDTSTSAGTSSGGTTGDISPTCGDGVVDDEEECDDGNLDDSDACLSNCSAARCGDGVLHQGVEMCDDAQDNGTYGHCNAECTDLGPRCGDGVAQAAEGEQCDALTPELGCVKDTCQWASSCLELKLAWADEATTGTYAIRRNGKTLNVHCEMAVDGGGYTILPYATAGNVLATAKQAEEACSSYGMRLFVPRSAEHLAAAAQFAAADELAPVGGGKAGTVQDYLGIMAIYPATVGQSCVGKPLRSADCPEWIATGTYEVSKTSLDMSQPGTNNCDNCSMGYIWSLMPPTLLGYESVYNAGKGATSSNFLCDVGDKAP